MTNVSKNKLSDQYNSKTDSISNHTEFNNIFDILIYYNRKTIKDIFD